MFKPKNKSIDKIEKNILNNYSKENTKYLREIAQVTALFATGVGAFYLGSGALTVEIVASAFAVVMPSSMFYYMNSTLNRYSDKTIFHKALSLDLTASHFKRVTYYKGFNFGLFNLTELGSTIKFANSVLMFSVMDLIISDEESSEILAKVQATIDSQAFQKTDVDIQKEYYNRELQPVLIKALSKMQKIVDESSKKLPSLYSLTFVIDSITDTKYLEHTKNLNLLYSSSELENRKVVVSRTSNQTVYSERNIKLTFTNSDNILKMLKRLGNETLSSDFYLDNLDNVYDYSEITREGYKSLDELYGEQEKMLIETTN